MKCMDDRSAGIPVLDEQHLDVFECFVFVKRTMARGGGWNDTHLALEALIKSFEFCAAVEESLMRIHDYPGYEGHRKEHVDLLLGLREMEKANLSTELTEKMIGSAFASTLKHHLAQDRSCARYLPWLSGQAPKIRR